MLKGTGRFLLVFLVVLVAFGSARAQSKETGAIVGKIDDTHHADFAQSDRRR